MRERLLLRGARELGALEEAGNEREAGADCGLTLSWLVPVTGVDFPGSRRLLPIFLDSLLLITIPRLPEYPAGTVDT